MSEAGVHFRDASGPPGMRIYAIGDVHGRLDLLTAMHAAIRAELERDRPADWRIIHLGDYVDRGPDSKGVLDFLVEARRDPRMVALYGNHDIRFLNFLADPAEWRVVLSFGGAETALSYGVDIDFSSMAGVLRDHPALQQAVPLEHVAFLKSLGLSVSLGDFFFCHAGIRPGIALDVQEEDDLIWIREEFHHHEGLHPKVVVHGHTIVSAAEIRDNRVNIDTGAFMTGRLTALAIEGREKRLLEISG